MVLMMNYGDINGVIKTHHSSLMMIIQLHLLVIGTKVYLEKDYRTLYPL